MKKPPTRCAIYARVSKRDGSQKPDNQVRVLKEFAGRSGWKVTEVFTDQETGRTLDRPALRNMLTAADRKEFDVLLFWRLDRLTRSGIADTLEMLRRLDELGILYHSHQEQLIRNGGPVGQLIVAIFATLASIEREAMSARTKAGMERARRQGKQIGRPRAILSKEKMQAQRNAGKSLAQIARAHGTSKATAQRFTTAPSGKGTRQPAHPNQSQEMARS